MFKKKQRLVISERDPTFKVRYLGNVLTAIVKGDGCVDRPINVLWNNYVTNSTKNSPAGLEMEMTVCNSGLKVVTKEQGLTDYRAHRITYTVCPQQLPKLFVWVYKHEGRKLKSEVRCHAVMCKTDVIAQTIASQLQERLTVALGEFKREKRRSQNSRISVKLQNRGDRNSIGHMMPSGGDGSSPGGGNVRTKFLKVGQNFRPPIDRTTSAPKLGSITEGDEEEELVADDVEEENGSDVIDKCNALRLTSVDEDNDVYLRSDSVSNGHVAGVGVVRPTTESQITNGRAKANESDEVQMLPNVNGVDSDSDDDGEPS